MPADKLLPLALEAVDTAARLLLSQEPGDIVGKGDRDMASAVDYEIERSMRAFLARRTPDIGFLGEEEGASEPGADRTWVLDPVDGTANFVHGLPLCGVSLSLVIDQETQLGVISTPFLNHLYSAVRDEGANCNGIPIRTRTTTSLKSAIVSLGDYAVGDNADQKNKARISTTTGLLRQVQRIRMIGSAATDLCWVARGWLDACVILANKPWDTSAGVLIAREAGAYVVDSDGSPHTWSSGATIATTAGVKDALVDEVQAALSDAA
jgi:myo-inositol-1(or 4)-monophosphatase